MRKPGASAAASGGDMERLSSQSFLTGEQRAALDAALAQKQASQAQSEELASGASWDSPDRHSQSLAHASAPASSGALSKDRHLSRSGRGRGKPKKSGGGGKWTWGASPQGAEEAGPAALDARDPNYDSEEEACAGEGAVLHRSTAADRYKRAVEALLREYLESGDLDEARARLRELGAPHLRHWLVQRAVRVALDRSEREREAVSVLLAALAGDGLAPGDVARGFGSLARALADLKLDVPDATELLALFACRAAVDEALAPAWVDSLAALGSAEARELGAACAALLRARHGAERLARCWHGGAGAAGWAAAREAVGSALDEFRAGGKEADVAAALRELRLPFFHHEVVKQIAARACAAEGEPARERWLGLLGALAGGAAVSETQVGLGLRRVAAQLDDLELDAPGAAKAFVRVLEAGRDRGWLPADLVQRNPGSEEEPPSPRSPPGAPSRAPQSDDSLAATGAAAPGGGRGGGESAVVEGAAQPPDPSLVTLSSLPGALSTTLPASLSAALSGAPRSLRGVADYKRTVRAAAAEYFESGDAGEVARTLSDTEQPGFAHLAVKVVVALALDRRDREREAASKLLAALVPAQLTREQASLGFELLLAQADDLALDVPDAHHLLALFLARAVADEVLAPRSLVDLAGALPADAPEAGGAAAVLRAAAALLGARHAGARLQACWHGRVATVRDLRAAIDAALDEYGAGGDARELGRCWAELGVPHYAHELVYRAARRLLEGRVCELGGGEGAEGGRPGVAGSAGGRPDAPRSPNAAPRSPSYLAALDALCAAGAAAPEQVERALGRLEGDLEDLSLDAPEARARLPALKAHARQVGWVQD